MSWHYYAIAFGVAQPSRLGRAPMGVYQHDSSDRWAYEEPIIVGQPAPPGDVLGAWDEAGGIIVPPTPEWESLRPYGNYINGLATGNLIAAHAAGVAQRQMEPDGRLFPATNEPYDLVAFHHWYDYSAPWAGWGVAWEMIGASATRDPSVRAIGIYTDPECTQYEYTMGGFVERESFFQVDENGDPLTVWASDTPAGKCDANNKLTMHYAVLYASLQEGHWTIDSSEDMQRRLFWEQNQDGSTIPQAQSAAATWVDSGEQATGNAGATVIVTNTAPFPIGTRIRIDGSDEADVTGIHQPGVNGIIIVDPWIRVTGQPKTIEVWQ